MAKFKNSWEDFENIKTQFKDPWKKTNFAYDRWFGLFEETSQQNKFGVNLYEENPDGLYDIAIISPNPYEVFKILTQNSSDEIDTFMPSIVCEIAVCSKLPDYEATVFPPISEIEWYLTIEGYYITKDVVPASNGGNKYSSPKWNYYNKSVESITFGSNFWNVDFKELIVGGLATLTVITVIEGKKFLKSVQFQIQGENPTPSMISEEL
ncbi:MAG: hypothetical protein R2798_03795 [Chitinophagales bacterium]|nr:hypothetical protein [Bacteroidota bacterium]MCB9043105.1 hypothetical protein [Chitinophagales bacterium]